MRYCLIYLLQLASGFNRFAVKHGHWRLEIMVPYDIRAFASFLIIFHMIELMALVLSLSISLPGL